MSFERAVERFAEQYVSRKTKRPFSATSKRNVLDNLLGSPLTSFRAQRGIQSVQDWNGDHAAEYLSRLQKDLRRDSATVKKVLGQLRSFGEFCDAAFHTSNAASLSLATMQVSSDADFERERLAPFTRVEMETLQAAARTDRDRLAMAMLLYTGVRPSELVALEEEHVHLERKHPVIEVRASALNARGTTATSARDVPLTIGQAVLPEMIREHLADSRRPPRATKVYLSRRSDAHGDWQPLTLGGLRAMLFDLGRETGIRCNAYRFRHTFCTWCTEGGMEMDHLRRILGLRKLDMIAAYYPRDTNQAAVAAASRVRF